MTAEEAKGYGLIDSVLDKLAHEGTSSPKDD